MNNYLYNSDIRMCLNCNHATIPERKVKDMPICDICESNDLAYIMDEKLQKKIMPCGFCDQPIVLKPSYTPDEKCPHCDCNEDTFCNNIPDDLMQYVYKDNE